MYCKRTIDLVKCNFNIIYPLQIHTELLQSEVQWNIAIIVVGYCKLIKKCRTIGKMYNIFFQNEKRDERCLCVVYSGIYYHVSTTKKCVGKKIWKKLRVYFLGLSRSVETENKKAIDHNKAYLFYLGFYPTWMGSVIPFTCNHFIIYNTCHHIFSNSFLTATPISLHSHFHHFLNYPVSIASLNTSIPFRSILGSVPKPAHLCIRFESHSTRPSHTSRPTQNFHLFRFYLRHSLVSRPALEAVRRCPGRTTDARNFHFAHNGGSFTTLLPPLHPATSDPAGQHTLHDCPGRAYIVECFCFINT